MGNSVHLDKRCAVERMGCGISRLSSGTAGQDLLLGSVYPCARVRVSQLVRARVPGACRRVCICRLGLCGYVRACVWVSIRTVRTGIWLSSPSSTRLRHGDEDGVVRTARRNLLLSSASLHQAGIWPCCPLWGAENRTGLGVKKLGGKKNQRAQPGCLLHQCNFNF